MKQYAFVIDCDRCIGCKGCQVACKLQNTVALGQGRNKVCTIGPNGVFPNLEMYFMTAMCQQCAEPRCTEVCPTGACYKDPEDGVIKIDRSMCMGCGSCKRACPYDCINTNKELRVADKCDLCAGLREKGETPACVRNCSGSALHYGNINDPESDVAKLLAETPEEYIYSLRSDGNAPSAKYILRNAKWRDVLPQECIEHSAWKKGGRKI